MSGVAFACLINDRICASASRGPMWLPLEDDAWRQESLDLHRNAIARRD
jgi:hypothetical protein